MNTIREKVHWQVRQIKEILQQTENELPERHRRDPLVIADYTEEEFTELKKGENYPEYCIVRDLVVDRLQELGIAEKVVLHKVDSVKYYKFLAEKKITHDSKALAYFASVDYMKQQRSKK